MKHLKFLQNFYGWDDYFNLLKGRIFFKNSLGRANIAPRQFLSFCFLLFILNPIYALTAKLQQVEIKQTKGKISLFFNLDRAISHKIFTLTNPDRVVVDFENTELAFNLATFHLNGQLIKRLRSGHPNSHTLRLVFEVSDSVMLRTTAANRNQVFSFDISANHPPRPPTPLKPSLPLPPANKPLRDVIVVLDAGHGGKDPGAIGPRHSAEKNLTLAMAQKLKVLIDREQGMHAVLTRTGDYYIELRERLNIARKHNADIFISIHADAFIKRASKGASVFALSQRGATSEAARWLAEKENYSELGGVNLKNLDDQSGLVRTVLIDLSQTATIAASLHMGEQVLRHLNKMTSLHNYKVEQARFMVLKSPDIPSILIETGFISNPQEEINLNNTSYQARLVQSIFQGLKTYFWEYPPHDTQIEASIGNKLHFREAYAKTHF